MSKICLGRVETQIIAQMVCCVQRPIRNANLLRLLESGQNKALMLGAAIPASRNWLADCSPCSPARLVETGARRTYTA